MSESAYAWEAEEWRSARYADDTAPCLRHHFKPVNGGGICRCGETVSPEEL